MMCYITEHNYVLYNRTEHNICYITEHIMCYITEHNVLYNITYDVLYTGA